MLRKNVVNSTTYLVESTTFPEMLSNRRDMLSSRRDFRKCCRIDEKCCRVDDIFKFHAKKEKLVESSRFLEMLSNRRETSRRHFQFSREKGTSCRIDEKCCRAEEISGNVVESTRNVVESTKSSGMLSNLRGRHCKAVTPPCHPLLLVMLEFALLLVNACCLSCAPCMRACPDSCE